MRPVSIIGFLSKLLRSVILSRPQARATWNWQSRIYCLKTASIRRQEKLLHSDRRRTNGRISRAATAAHCSACEVHRIAELDTRSPKAVRPRYLRPSLRGSIQIDSYSLAEARL